MLCLKGNSWSRRWSNCRPSWQKTIRAFRAARWSCSSSSWNTTLCWRGTTKSCRRPSAKKRSFVRGTTAAPWTTHKDLNHHQSPATPLLCLDRLSIVLSKSPGCCRFSRRTWPCAQICPRLRPTCPPRSRPSGRPTGSSWGSCRTTTGPPWRPCRGSWPVSRSSSSTCRVRTVSRAVTAYLRKRGGGIRQLACRVKTDLSEQQGWRAPQLFRLVYSALLRGTMGEIDWERGSRDSSITSHTAASPHSKSASAHALLRAFTAARCWRSCSALSPPLSGQNTSCGIWRGSSLATGTCGPGAASRPEPGVTFDHFRSLYSDLTTAKSEEGCHWVWQTLIGRWAVKLPDNSTGLRYIACFICSK